MSSDYRAIGNEILEKLEIDPARLSEALSELNVVVRECLESDAWNEVHTYCESARKFCDAMHGSAELREWGNVLDPTHAEGIFHAYEGISHLYRVEEAREKKDPSQKSAELAKAIDCLEKSRQSFHFEYRDQWNEVILCLSLGKLYRSQNKLNDALLAFQLAFQRSSDTFNRLSIKRTQEIVEVVSAEIEKTRMLFRVLPVINEIAAGKEKPALDDIIGYMRRTDEFEFEFEGQALKAELLRGKSRLTFLQGYDYVAMLISGDSMDQARIAPNDYIILRRPKGMPLEPFPGDIVAVVFRDEDNKATLKRLHFDKSSGSVTLKPESSNPEHEPRVLRPEAFAGDSPSVAVVGIAIAVLKPKTKWMSISVRVRIS